MTVAKKSRLPLYCPKRYMDMFLIRFRRNVSNNSAGRRSHKEQRDMRPSNKEMVPCERLQSIRDLFLSSPEFRRGIMPEFLQSWGLRQWGTPVLALGFGRTEVNVQTDGVFKGSSLNKVLAYMDLTAMEKRRIEHVRQLILHPGGKLNSERDQLWRRELKCMTPDKEEEDVQIAAVMAALAQAVLMAGGQLERRDGTPAAALGLWVHVIAVGQGQRGAKGRRVGGVYFYRGWVCEDFLKRLQDPETWTNAGIEIEYKSTALAKLGPAKDPRRVAKVIDRWLKRCEMF
ncbi:hypothetical protein HC256_004121 [Beauveria bassiana]|nr:hypothetical protein HC256_004121 [Beauveria bassiana]